MPIRPRNARDGMAATKPSCDIGDGFRRGRPFFGRAVSGLVQDSFSRAINQFLPCVKLTGTSMPPQMENNATASPRVLTIGHSNHTVEHFLGLLKAQAVQGV